jgi:CRP-like cAMP-binding protein
MQTNYILSRIHPESCRSLLARADRVRFERGTFFSEPASRIGRVIFPFSGLISVVVELTSGERIELAMVGAGGALGGLAAFGAERHTATAIGQIAGECWSVPAALVAEVADEDRLFRRLLLRHEQFLSAQAQHTAACNAKHMISERLAGWLLRSRDAIGSDQVSLTQEAMAHMLGAQRASVSMAAGLLSAHGCIEYTRGQIRILDAQKLSDRACECHEALTECHRTLFEDIAEQAPRAEQRSNAKASEAH